jgi:hypothetical protein
MATGARGIGKKDRRGVRNGVAAPSTSCRPRTLHLLMREISVVDVSDEDVKMVNRGVRMVNHGKRIGVTTGMAVNRVQ